MTLRISRLLSNQTSFRMVRKTDFGYVNYNHVNIVAINCRFDNRYIGAFEMTLAPTKGVKLRNVITHSVICVNQKTGSIVFRLTTVYLYIVCRFMCDPK